MFIDGLKGNNSCQKWALIKFKEKSFVFYCGCNVTPYYIWPHTSNVSDQGNGSYFVPFNAYSLIINYPDTYY
jgi:hypothetical protein